MFKLIDEYCIHEPEAEIARHPAGDGDFGDEGAWDAADHPDSTAGEDLATFGLLDLGAESPPDLRTVSDLPAGDRLAAFGLLEAGGPTGRRSLDSVSPRDLLKVLGLLA